MKITNISGTTPNICKCGSWLAHWKNFSGQPIPTRCPVEGCTQKPEVGAHVQKDIYIDRNWYIVPLCKTHNVETGRSLVIKDDVKLVSANVTETCGKVSY